MDSEAFVFVADDSRAIHLTMSIASVRSCSVPIRVIDLGLANQVKDRIKRLHEDVQFLSPIDELQISSSIPGQQRYKALFQKTQLGRLVRAEKIVFLDADIIVVSPRFRDILTLILPDSLVISPSAWDRDLHWKYSNECVSLLRSHSGIADLSLDFPVYNSGVWGMTGPTAQRASETWTRLYRSSVLDDELRSKVNAGSQIGDQEYLGLTAHLLSIPIVPLHGSFNMQVHESKMQWQLHDGEAIGGHLHEELAPVAAIHYNDGIDVSISPQQIKSRYIREWIHSRYAALLEGLNSVGISHNVRNELR